MSMSSSVRWWFVWSCSVIALAFFSQERVSSRSGAVAKSAVAASPNIVISQVYGGGGNSGALFTHDFIELFNRSNAPVNITGWAVQYASSTGTTWQKTDLTGSVAPGQRYLVQQASGGANGSALPTPDATGTIAMAATAGKIVLTNNNTLITSGTSCPAGASVVDLVGYGSAANCFEGTGPTATLSSTTAALRVAGGCTDSDNNNTDFSAVAPNPRNTAATPAVCGATTNPTGVGAASPNPVAAGSVTLLTVNVTPGANPTSTGLIVSADLTALGGVAAQALVDDGSNGDATAGDNVFSYLSFVASATVPGAKSLPVSISDAQSRSGNTTINLTVLPPPLPGNVVVSQIFGGGGNSGAPFTHDFIELFNRSAAPVSLTGWAVQYTSSTGSSWQKVDLSGNLAPGQYYLVQLASAGATGAPLPAPDASGTITMASTAGKVALTNTTTLLNSSCPIGSNVVDFVGYGTAANCFEGFGTTPAPNSERAAIRAGLGCTDNNDNVTDFFIAAPQPKNTASPFTVCGEGAKFDNLTVKLTDTTACTTSGNVVAVEVRFTNSGTRAQTDNPGAEFFTALPALWQVLPNSCTASSGVCEINAGQIEWNGGATINQTITINFRVQLGDGVAAGATVCLDGSLRYDSDNDGMNNLTVIKTGCLTVTCAPPGPGNIFPATAELSDQKAGSVLVYPLYSSRVTGFSRENARLSITNIDAQRRVAVHLFFIQDDAPGVADAYLCLTPNQTASFLASDVDPDVTGYLVAVAVDERTGCPINFNFLLGDVYVKLSSGHAANLAAQAFSALAGRLPVCDDTATEADLNFDGVSYSAAPRVLAADNIPSPVDGNQTMLIIDRIGGNLATGVSTVSQIVGLLFDDAENAFSFEFPASARQFRAIISNTFPRTAPRVPQLIPAGRSGWLKFWRSSDGGIVGAMINFNANANASSAAFNQGHNLQVLTRTTESSFAMPVFPPGC